MVKKGAAPAESALLVPVPPVQSVARWVRWRFDPSARARMPPHVTVLYPFVSPPPSNEVIRTLRDLFAGVAPFGFDLTEVAWFDERVAYLTPEPSGPFESLTWQVVEKFPGYLPYRGAYGTEHVVPHVTLATSGRPDARRRAARRVAKRLPVHATASEVLLMARYLGGKPWRALESFSLGGGSSASAIGS